MKLNITPHPKQIECLQLLSSPEKKYVGYGGAKSGGKSYVARIWLVLRALKYPGSRGVLIRSTFPDLERSAIDKMKQEYKGVYDVYNERKKTFTFSNGSTIEMAYIQHDKDLGNYQGVEYESIVLDEAQQHSRKVYERMKTCLRTTLDIVPRFLITFNWGDKGHAWLKKLFWDRQANEKENINATAFLHALVYDNPSVNEDYVQELESLPEAIRKLWLLGDPTGAADGQCFTDFSTELQLVPEHLTIAQTKGRLFGSLDVGTSHATAFTLSFITHTDDIHILFSYCSQGYTIAEHAQNIFDNIESFKYTYGAFPETIWADPAAFTKVRLNEQSIRSPLDEFIDLFKERKKITKFERANNARANGTQIMKSLIKEKRVRYYQGYNQALVDAMERVIVDPNDIESYKKEPTDEDDTMDSTRYNIVGCNSVMANIKQRKNNRKPLTRKERLLSGKLSQSNNSFYDVDNMNYI